VLYGSPYGVDLVEVLDFMKVYVRTVSDDEDLNVLVNLVDRRVRRLPQIPGADRWNNNGHEGSH
jgi:hypothetical protein